MGGGAFLLAFKFISGRRVADYSGGAGGPEPAGSKSCTEELQEMSAPGGGGQIWDQEARARKGEPEHREAACENDGTAARWSGAACVQQEGRIGQASEDSCCQHEEEACRRCAGWCCSEDTTPCMTSRSISACVRIGSALRGDMRAHLRFSTVLPAMAHFLPGSSE